MIATITNLLYESVKLRYSTKEILQQLRIRVKLPLNVNNENHLTVIVTQFQFRQIGLEQTANKLLEYIP